MTIRNRTETGRGGRVPVAGSVAVAGLAGAGAMHVLWACGSTWPAADMEDLADLVMGRPPVAAERPDRLDRPDGGGDGTRRGRGPDAAATFAVAGLLGAAALLTAGASGLIPLPGPRAERLARFGTRIASAVLLARGGAGLAVSALDLVPTTERFRRWNLRLYSPLCLGLGGAAACSARAR